MPSCFVKACCVSGSGHSFPVCGFVLLDFLAVCDGPTATTATITKDELLQMHKDMFIIRRMEITSDTEYKVWLWCGARCT
jgi:hypothetical protein